MFTKTHFHSPSLHFVSIFFMSFCKKYHQNVKWQQQKKIVHFLVMLMFTFHLRLFFNLVTLSSTMILFVYASVININYLL